MKVVIVSALLFSSLAFAQEAKPKAPPVVTDAQKLAYFKANSEYQAALAQAQQVVQPKKDALDAAGKSIVEVCGKEFTATMDAGGYPVCVAIAKPAPVKPAEKPVEPKK